MIYAPSDEKTWNAVIGGPVPVNANFCLTATIEKEPEKVQAFTNAIWRSVQWIKANSPENILGTIERFVGSTSRDANLLEIGRAEGRRRLERPDQPRSPTPAARRSGTASSPASKPIKLEDAVADRFLKAAHAKYPA